MIETKTCTDCQIEKPVTAFFAEPRGGYRCKCKACCKSTWKKPMRTAAQRAEYKRRKGVVSAPYIPLNQLLREAALKREVRAIKSLARSAFLERHRALREASKPKPVYSSTPLEPSSAGHALIALCGKYAVGKYTHAIIDTDNVDYLSQWRWKAKWNAKHNNIYAVRNAFIDGKCVTIRMHRVVAGLQRGDQMEPDHQNGFGLDNRRDNIIVGNRCANLSRKPWARPRTASGADASHGVTP